MSPEDIKLALNLVDIGNEDILAQVAHIEPEWVAHFHRNMYKITYLYTYRKRHRNHLSGYFADFDAALFRRRSVEASRIAKSRVIEPPKL